MTESVRRWSSKWDLKEDPDHFPTEIRQDRAWSGRRGEFINDRESKSEWRSSRGLSSRDPKWSDIDAKRMPRNEGNSGWSSSMEPSIRNRGVHNDDIDRRAYNDMSKSMTLDGDRSYSMSMSPGLDGWRQQSRSPSPKSNWSRSHRSRSRSRSPHHGFRRELEGSNDRRSGSRVAAPPCTAFAAGRCRQGSNCRFFHQDNHDYDGRRHSGSSPENGGSKHQKGGFIRNNIEEQMDRPRDKNSHGHDVYDGELEKSDILRNNRSGRCDEFLKGNCRKGSSGRYAHDSAPSEGYGIRERDHDKKDGDAPYGHDTRHEPRRVNSKPCKFFAAGHCRQGDSCRFSHDGIDRGSPERRSGDENRRGHELDHEKRSWRGPKWNDIAPDSAHKGPEERLLMDKLSHNLGNENRSWGGPKWSDITDNHNLSNENKSWDGPKWSDIVTDSDAKVRGWGIDRGVERMGVVESRTNEKSFVHMQGRNLDNASRTWGGPSCNDKPADIDIHKSPQGMKDNNGGGMSFRESMVSGTFLSCESMLSSGAKEHNPRITNEDMGHSQDSESRNRNEISLPTGKQNMTPGVTGQPHLSSNANGHSQQVIPTPAFNLNERVQQIVSPPSSNPYHQKMAQDSVDLRFMAQEEPVKKPDLLDPRLMAQQVSSGSPMTQNVVSNEQVAQITNISASLAQIFANGQHIPQLYAALNPTSGLVPSHPNSVGPPQVVAPLIQPSETTQSQKQYDPISDSIDQDKAADGDSLFPEKKIAPSSISVNPNGGDASNIDSLGEKVDESLASTQLEKVVDQNEADNIKKEHDTGPSGEMDADGRVDEEGKKSKDPKGMRVFKFALVEFVKELLKPTWKEGQMSKEAHKTIVKKVVDKVTGTIQGAQIPQTQEKIDHYLSYSKPKLTKLVQAYVEKYLKT